MHEMDICNKKNYTHDKLFFMKKGFKQAHITVCQMKTKNIYCRRSDSKTPWKFNLKIFSREVVWVASLVSILLLI